ncbi:diguanylate cyclase [Colwelliaceae bacterium 6471]
MHKQTQKYALKFNLPLFCLLLLISCKSIAFQNSPTSEFSEFLQRVEKLQDTNPSDAHELLSNFTDSIDDYPIEERIRFYKTQSELYVELSQYQLGIAAATTGLELAKKLTSPSILMADLSYSRGFSYESLGDYDAAAQEYLNGLEVAESLDDQVYIAYGFINLGALYYLTERFERSLIMLNDALTIANKSDDEELKGYVNSELGILYSYLGQEDKSLVFYERSYEHYKKAGTTFYALNSLMNIGVNHSGNKRYEEAIAIYKRVIADSDTLANDSILYTAYSGLAWAYMKKEPNDPEAARQYMLIAGQYVENVQQHEAPLIYALDKAYILESMKRYDEALVSLDEAEKIIDAEKQFQSTIPYVNVLKLRADIYFALNDFERAYHIQTQYLALYKQVRESNNTAAIEELRLRYESEHADLENKLLAQKKSVNELELNKANQQVENQRLYVMVMAIVALGFAYFLLKVLRGHKRLLTITRTDGLTGVANRRHLFEFGNQYFDQAVKQDLPFSVLMLDIDDFKKINDQHGHKAGDKVLKEVAKLGHDVMRKTDRFGRFGGEEFIALLTDTNLEQAANIAERIRKTINCFPWTFSPATDVSVSIGIATLDQSTHASFESLVKSADALMYKAKAEGKNMVCA